jgi:hypothetical protein
MQVHYKDLGVWLSSDLKSSKHCRETVVVATKLVHLIRRTLWNFSQKSYLLLYKALVRPRLEYASSAWNPHYAKDILALERVQKLATHLISALKEEPYEARLMATGLQKLETRRLRADLILLYQMCHNMVDYDVHLLFEPARDERVRGHSYKLRVKTLPRKDLRKFFFANRVVESRNRLDEEIVSAPSLAAFKNGLHKSGVLPPI